MPPTDPLPRIARAEGAGELVAQQAKPCAGLAARLGDPPAGPVARSIEKCRYSLSGHVSCCGRKLACRD